MLHWYSLTVFWHFVATFVWKGKMQKFFTTVVFKCLQVLALSAHSCKTFWWHLCKNKTKYVFVICVNVQSYLLWFAGKKYSGICWVRSLALLPPVSHVYVLLGPTSLMEEMLTVACGQFQQQLLPLETHCLISPSSSKTFRWIGSRMLPTCWIIPCSLTAWLLIFCRPASVTVTQVASMMERCRPSSVERSKSPCHQVSIVHL